MSSLILAKTPFRGLKCRKKVLSAKFNFLKKDHSLNLGTTKDPKHRVSAIFWCLPCSWAFLLPLITFLHNCATYKQ